MTTFRRIISTEIVTISLSSRRVGAVALSLVLASTLGCCTTSRTIPFARFKEELSKVAPSIPRKGPEIVTAVTPQVPRMEAIKDFITSKDSKPRATSVGRALDLVLSDKTVESVQVVFLQVHKLTGAGQSFGMLGGPETPVQMRVMRGNTNTTTHGLTTFSGSLANDAGATGDALLVWRGDRASGLIRTEQALFTVRPLGNGLHALTTTLPAFADRSRDDGGEVGDPTSAESGELTGLTAAPDCSPTSQRATLRVLVYATAAALQRSDELGNDDIQARVESAALLMTTALKKSAVDAKVQIVGDVGELATDNESQYAEVLRHLIAGTGEFARVHSEREQNHADVVILIVNNEDARDCGLVLAIPASAANAYAVVNQYCLGDRLSFAHEIGHLAGAHHEPGHDGKIVPTPAFSQGFFRKELPRFATVMAHRDSCFPCIRIFNYSNPDVLYESIPTGTIDRNNNACILRIALLRMSKFGESQAASAAQPLSPPNPSPDPDGARGDQVPIAPVKTTPAFSDTENDDYCWDKRIAGSRAGPRIYMVAPGDNLSILAACFYGRQIWQRIYRANRHNIDKPDLIFPGQKLVIPRPLLPITR